MDKFCMACGHPVGPQHRFCTQCGSRVNKELIPWPGKLTNQPAIETMPVESLSYYTEETIVFGMEVGNEETEVLGFDPLGEYDIEKVVPEERVYLIDSNGLNIPLEPPCVVGRGKQADVRITDDSSISRQHVRIEHDPQEYFVQDLEAVNGTFIDGVRVPAGEKSPITDGQTLRLGATDLLFRVSVL